MAVRDCQELGSNLFKIALRLLNNQRLCKYLKYTDANPLDNPDFKNPVKEILHHNIKVVPLVNVDENTTEGTICVVYDSGEVNSNAEFDDIFLSVLIYTPLREWQINDMNLRPFLIMSEIEKSIKNKTIDGLGKLKYNGFKLKLVTDDISCYQMLFSLDTFD